MQREDIKKWKSLYPMYINKNFSQEQGRKTSLINSVADPTLEEISQILNHLKIKHAIEIDKRHPTDFFNYGRVRYMLEDEQGNLVNPDIRTRKQLANTLGSLIGKLKSRNVSAQPTNQKKHGKKRN